MSKSKTKNVNQQCLKAEKGDRVYVGLDVHKKTIHAAIRINGQLAKCFVIPAEPKAVIKLLAGVREGIRLVVYEAGPTGYGLARALRKEGLVIEVVAPGKTPQPANRGNKSDRLDCRILAEYAEKEMLVSIVIPTEQEEVDRHIIRLRDQLMKKQRRVKHQIKSMLLQFGIKEPAGLRDWTNTSVAALGELKLNGPVKLSLGMLVDELIFLKQQLKKLGGWLRKLSETSRYKDKAKILQTHPGVGEVTSMKYLAEMYQPGRFSKPEQAAGFLGLAPKVYQSGETRKEGGIQKSGREALRAILIEASWVWIGKDDRGRQLYRKLLRNTGNGKKAIVGVARHMAINLWCMLTRQETYKPAKQSG